MIDFSFMPKIIRILNKIMFHEYILKFPSQIYNFSLVKCIAKNFIWPTLKAIFLNILWKSMKVTWHTAKYGDPYSEFVLCHLKCTHTQQWNTHTVNTQLGEQSLASCYFDVFAPSDSRFSNSCISAKYCPILTNHTSMKILFRQLSGDVYVLINHYDWFCGPGSHLSSRLLYVYYDLF